MQRMQTKRWAGPGCEEGPLDRSDGRLSEVGGKSDRGPLEEILCFRSGVEGTEGARDLGVAGDRVLGCGEAIGSAVHLA